MAVDPAFYLSSVQEEDVKPVISAGVASMPGEVEGDDETKLFKPAVELSYNGLCAASSVSL